MKKLFKQFVLIFMATLFVAMVPVETKAFDFVFFSTNNIQLSGEKASTCIASETVLSGKTNREKIYNFLVSKGLKSYQAIGVLANIQAESGFNPTRRNTSVSSDFNNGAYGIAQWIGGRRDSLADHMRRTVPAIFSNYYNEAYSGPATEADGFTPKNSETGELMPLGDNDALLTTQLNFLMDETSVRPITSLTSSNTSAERNSNEWESLKKSTNLEDAVKIWLYNFERPGNYDIEVPKRMAIATSLEQIIRAEIPQGPNATGDACLNTTSGDVLALQAKVKQYAWPEYHKPKYVFAKEEYKAAVDTAVLNRKYVGGIAYRGIDCGGFVTRVMIDSGFEPEYNSKNGNTVAQKAWLEENWEKIGSGGSINTADLQPGDVAMLPGHTFMFAGTNIEGFGTTTSGWKGVASASLDERAPMAGIENLTGNTTTWYRKKVATHE